MHPNFSRHRGPYVLSVTRPDKLPGFFCNEWLKGEIDAEDVEDEALGLLTDPRDTIVGVYVWSVREHQFVLSFKLGDENDR